MPNQSAVFSAPPLSLLLVRGGAGLEIEWSERVSNLSAALLRHRSPAADHRQAMRQQDAAQATEGQLTAVPDVVIKRLVPVGHYAIGIEFSDGHKTGIYSWEYLWELSRPVSSRKRAGR